MTRRSDGPKEGGGHEEAAGGVADPAARVAAGAFAQTYAGRAGNHWGDNVVLPNANGPYSGPFDVFALKSGAGSGGADLLKKETKTAAVAASLQSFTYDDDGNMLSDGIWTYSWDAENRLTSLTATSLAVAGGYPNLQLEFKYDYLGRRIEKKVTNLGANGGVIDWRRFLYDGWSMVAEYTVSGTAPYTLTQVRTYTWGLDIARSLKDAGGVGALLQITDVVSTKTYLPTYDGNGNIVSLLNGSSGALAAVYEYSPYGEQLRAETIDSTIANNPVRFSTKYYDAETGLYDYGRRYYNPRDGRFLGRDPIEEKGGLHLYAFCLNNPITKWDRLGMWPEMIDPNTWFLYGVDDIADDNDATIMERFEVKVDSLKSPDIDDLDDSRSDDGRPGNDPNDDSSEGGGGGGAPNTAGGSSTYDNGSKVIAGAGAVQTTAALAGSTGATIGSNGKVYTGTVRSNGFTNGWGGNGSVTTVKIAEVATKVGIVLAAAGTAWDWINVFNGSGSISPTKATVNTGFTTVGLVGGSMGGAVSAGYFLIDNFYPGGWTGNGGSAYNGAGALRDYATTVQQNQQVVPNWRPRGDPPFN